MKCSTAMSADLEVSSMEYRSFEERSSDYYKGWTYGCEFEIVQQVVHCTSRRTGGLATNTSSFSFFFFESKN